MRSEDEFTKGRSAGEIEAFLDQCLAEYGEKSVLNISSVSPMFTPLRDTDVVAAGAPSVMLCSMLGAELIR